MIITISGDIGSGKSTTGKLLAKQLGYEYLSTGAIQRKIAEDMGITTLELNLLTEKLTEIDDKIDGYTSALNDSNDDFIVDSRLAWNFIPSSYKVFLLCDSLTAAKRISLDDQRKCDETNKEVEHLLVKIRERRKSEKRRFLEKYKIDFEDLSNYDLIIDSSLFSPETLVAMIIDGVRLYYESQEV